MSSPLASKYKKLRTPTSSTKRTASWRVLTPFVDCSSKGVKRPRPMLTPPLSPSPKCHVPLYDILSFSHPQMSSLKDELARINSELVETQTKVNKLEGILTPLLPLVPLVTAANTMDSTLTYKALGEAATLVDTLTTEITQRLHCESQVIIYNVPHKVPALKAAQPILKTCDLDATICRCFRMRKNSPNTSCPLLIEFDNSSAAAELIIRQRMITKEPSLKNVRISLARTKLQRELKACQNNAGTLIDKKDAHPPLSDPVTATGKSNITALVPPESPTFVAGSTDQKPVIKPRSGASQLPPTRLSASAPTTPKRTARANNNVDLDDATETPINSDAILLNTKRNRITPNLPAMTHLDRSPAPLTCSKTLHPSEAHAIHMKSPGNVPIFGPKNPSVNVGGNPTLKAPAKHVNRSIGRTMTLRSFLPPIDLTKPTSILGNPPHPMRDHSRNLSSIFLGQRSRTTTAQPKLGTKATDLPPKLTYPRPTLQLEPTSNIQHNFMGQLTTQVGSNYDCTS